MNDLIRIKSIQGELKRSVKRRDLGITLSTEELIIQKPHVNYHVVLSDIISITLYDTPKDWKWQEGKAELSLSPSHTTGDRYRFHIAQAMMHNRSGIFRLAPVEMILPLHEAFLREISEWGKLHAF